MNCKEFVEDQIAQIRQAVGGAKAINALSGGAGQSRTFMLLLKKAHIGEVSATVWPKVLKDMCKKKNIHVIE